MTISGLKKLAIPFALAAATLLGGCVTNGMSFTPQQGRELGQGLGGAAGAVLGNYATGSESPLVRALGAGLGTWNGRQIGGALGEAAAANTGHCKQRVIYRADGSRAVTADCGRQTGFPGSVPAPY